MKPEDRSPDLPLSRIRLSDQQRTLLEALALRDERLDGQALRSADVLQDLGLAQEFTLRHVPHARITDRGHRYLRR